MRYSVNKGSIRVPWHKNERNLNCLGASIEEYKDGLVFDMPSQFGMYGGTSNLLTRLEEIEMVET